MPLTTYIAGEVLTAASLNDNFTFAAANPASGLTLVSATTIGSAVASVTVSSAFSATYDAYKITITGGTPSSSCDIAMTLGASATGYYSMASLVAYSGGATTTFGVNNGSNWSRAGGGLSGQLLTFDVNLFNPFLAQYSYFTNGIVFLANAGPGGGYHGVATSYSAFTITPSAGTLTGGIIRVYGYKNS